VHTLTIVPEQLTIQAPARARLHEVLDQHGIALTAYCDGMGTCGKCVVLVTCAGGGHPPVSDADRRHLHEDELARGLRLACQWRVGCDATIEIPARSRLEHMQVQGKGGEQGPTVRPAAAGARQYGMAIDIGTTTVVGSLLDVENGQVLAVAAGLNRQRRFGADVISRIHHAQQDGGLGELHAALVATLDDIMARACAEAHVPVAQLRELVLTGNTVMLHSVQRAPMDTLAVLPFTPAINEARRMSAASLGLACPAHVMAYTFPVIGGFVGGDTVSCILATDMDERDDCHMIIDIGTNGEVALGSRAGWVTASAPAGPAFEGARISCGMPGAPGAIEHVTFTPAAVELDVIGETAPMGVCGTGLIDAVAALLDTGVVDETGRLVAPEEVPGAAPAWVRARIVEQNAAPAFVLFDPQTDAYEHTAEARPLYLTQRDIRELQLAKAAIAAACELLLRTRGLTWADVTHVYLAGAFGNYLRPATAQRIGLLPPLPLAQIAFIGNAASTGARRALVSSNDRRRAERIARVATHVELAADAAFQQCYADHLLFVGRT